MGLFDDLDFKLYVARSRLQWKTEEAVEHLKDAWDDALISATDKIEEKAGEFCRSVESAATAVDEAVTPVMDKGDAILQIARELPLSFQAEVIDPGITDWYEIVLEKRRPGRERKLLVGDIIGVPRVQVYEHYGIYVGNGDVVHFYSDESDTSRENVIQKTCLSEFLKENLYFFAIDVDAIGSLPWEGYRIYSAEETVKRALSCVGNRDYDVLFNNCEQFAYWCKTGQKDMRQLRDLWGILGQKWRIPLSWG